MIDSLSILVGAGVALGGMGVGLVIGEQVGRAKERATRDLSSRQIAHLREELAAADRTIDQIEAEHDAVVHDRDAARRALHRVSRERDDLHAQFVALKKSAPSPSAPHDTRSPSAAADLPDSSVTAAFSFGLVE